MTNREELIAALAAASGWLLQIAAGKAELWSGVKREVDRLLERVGYWRLCVIRAHGRPQALWKAKDPAGIAAWLRENPSDRGSQPTAIQLKLRI